jgi:hypothetical protein
MPDYITGAEFGRWRTDFVAFRAELHTQLHDGFAQMNARLDAINGRGRANSEQIAVIETELERLQDIGTDVATIKEKGCAQLANHGAIVKTLQDGGESVGWPRKKKVAVGGGLIAGGAGLWELVHALLDHFMK